MAIVAEAMILCPTNDLKWTTYNKAIYMSVCRKLKVMIKWFISYTYEYTLRPCYKQANNTWIFIRLPSVNVTRR